CSFSDLQSKVKKRVWVFFAEGQRSLPHPHYRKRCAPRRSFEIDITHETAAFNHDRTDERAAWLLSPGVVAQMTRFGLTQKALVNHQARRNPLFAPNPAKGRRNHGEFPSRWPETTARPPHPWKVAVRRLLNFCI
ncbi:MULTISPECIES: hypothetical protein, partial [unclassified Mesorhizobium]|uniref:hypothetical protein n=1 Tax=unclassified Mesorhizobium TaxID=325217 RepID=UPI0019D49EE5